MAVDAEAEKLAQALAYEPQIKPRPMTASEIMERLRARDAGRRHVGQVTEEAEKLAFALRGTQEVVITESELVGSGSIRPRYIMRKLVAAGIPAYLDSAMSVCVRHGRLEVSRRRRRIPGLEMELDQVYEWLF